VDEVDHVGSFIEVEILTEEDRYEDAQAVVLQITQELGLQQRELRSYLQMVLESQGKQTENESRSSPPSNKAEVAS